MADLDDNISLNSSDSDSRPATRSTTKENGERNVPTHALRKLNLTSNKFMENFNPETSAREKRKLHRKLNTNSTKKISGVIYDEKGRLIANGLNVCDCLMANCPGCFFPCSKCESTKCGSECRVNRKYVYESVEIEGHNTTYKNTYLSAKKVTEKT